MSHIYLSRRNLLTLLSKLERDAAGDNSTCTIVKHRDPSPSYQQTMDSIRVTAVHDEEYYPALGRSAGEMHPSDEQNLPSVSTGVKYSGSIL